MPSIAHPHLHVFLPRPAQQESGGDALREATKRLVEAEAVLARAVHAYFMAGEPGARAAYEEAFRAREEAAHHLRDVRALLRFSGEEHGAG